MEKKEANTEEKYSAKSYESMGNVNDFFFQDNSHYD